MILSGTKKTTPCLYAFHKQLHFVSLKQLTEERSFSSSTDTLMTRLIESGNLIL